jgi:hypothetical protein
VSSLRFPFTSSISILGVGVTEAGLSSKDTRAMKDLYEILQLLQENNQPNRHSGAKLCVINTDNVPSNGSLIQSYMLGIAQAKNAPDVEAFLNAKVSFLNSMVDRITSQREGSNGMVPKCEPIPAKALVLLDENGDLARSSQFQKHPGVKIRTTKEQLDTDIALKLRVANGTHTAIAHALALLQNYQTDVLATEDPGTLFMKYLDSIAEQQIVPAAEQSQSISCSLEEAVTSWQDWRHRLVHPNFGLSSFFITQNGTAKGGIRWGPTVADLFLSNIPTTAAIAFAYAVLLRWLTPMPGSETTHDISRGWLDGFNPNAVANNIKDANANGTDVVEYADGLKYCAQQGWYEFKCPLNVTNPNDTVESSPIPLTVLMRESVKQRPNKCVVAIRAYLLAAEGGNLNAQFASHADFESLVHAIAAFYSRMVSSSENNRVLLDILKELESRNVGGLIGFDTPCSTMTDYYLYLSGL